MILAELSEKIGISVTSVSNNLKKLTEKGIIKRIGADKNGYWQINSKKMSKKEKYNENWIYYRYKYIN